MQVSLNLYKCEACNVVASYGLPGGRRRFCATHWTVGMVGAWPLHSCCACRAWRSAGSACCSPRNAHVVLRCIWGEPVCSAMLNTPAKIRFARQVWAVLQ